MPAQTNVTITENAENSDSNHSNATSGRRLLQNVTSNTTDGDGTDTAATTMIATTTTPISCTCCETPITSAPDTAAATLAISTTPIPVLLQCWGQADSTMSTTGKIASSLWPIGATTTTCGAAQGTSSSPATTANGGFNSITTAAGLAGTTPQTTGAPQAQSTVTMTSADTTYATTTPALAGTTPQTTGAPEAQSTVTVTSADTTYATTTPVPAGDRRRQLLQVASTPDFCVQYTAEISDVKYTTGGCLGQLLAQNKLPDIKCEYDGQKLEISAPFLGQGDTLPLTIFCCKTPLCNGCSALEKTSASRRTGARREGNSSTSNETTSSTPNETATTNATIESSNSTINETNSSTFSSAPADAAATTTAAVATSDTTADVTTAASSAETTPSPTDVVEDVYQCAVKSTATPLANIIATTPIPLADVELVVSETFTLPSPEELATKGFTFKFSDPKYAGIGAMIPPGAWPPGDTRTPSLALYEAKDHHLSAKSDNAKSEVAGYLIDFQPSPITFLVPITVILPVYEIDSDMDYVVAVFDPTLVSWLIKPVSDDKKTIVDGKVQGETNSFSVYAALSSPKDKSRCNTGCIVGAVIGSISGAMCICLCLWFCGVYGNTEDEMEEDTETPPFDSRDPTHEIPKDNAVSRDLLRGAGDIEKGPNSPSHALASDQVDGGVEDDELEDGEHIYDV